MPHNVLITGGAGFIGCNLAGRLRAGHQVTLFDNLSRSGAAPTWPGCSRARRATFALWPADLATTPRCAPRPQASALYHLAGQMAVTTSVTDPRLDFEVNALGTFNVLEAARQAATIRSSSTPPPTRSTAAWRSGGRRRAHALRFCRLSPGCARNAAAGLPFALRLLQGRRRSVHSRLCPHLWPAHRGIPAKLHLRPTADGCGRSGLGGLVHHRRRHGGPSPFTATANRCATCSSSTTCSTPTGDVERIDVTAGQVYNIGGGPDNTWRLDRVRATPGGATGPPGVGEPPRLATR